MANIKKTEEEKLQPIIGAMNWEMIGTLDGIALDNSLSRNELIRQACNFLIANKKKFNLK